MKIRIEVDTGHGEAGTNKELKWKWLDKLVFWWITRDIMRHADQDLLRQITGRKKS